MALRLWWLTHSFSSLQVFFFESLLFIWLCYVYGCYAFTSVCHAFAWHPWSSEESTGSAESELQVVVSCRLSSNPGSLEKRSVLLITNHLSSPSVCYFVLLQRNAGFFLRSEITENSLKTTLVMLLAFPANRPFLTEVVRERSSPPSWCWQVGLHTQSWEMAEGQNGLD